MREVLNALEWVRGEMWRFNSPDFVRQRQAELRVEQLCARLGGGADLTGADEGRLAGGSRGRLPPRR